MSDIRTINLRPAYSWDCHACESENFTRGGVPDLTGEDLEFLRSEHGVEPWEVGQFTMVPKAVVCSNCGKSYATQIGGETEAV